MKKPTAEAIADDLNQRRRVERYEDAIIAYNLTGNALHLWAAMLHRRRCGLPVPDDLLDRLAEYGQRLIGAAQKPGAGAKSFADALDLQSGAKGMTAWQRAEQQRRKVRKLRLMDHLRRNHVLRYDPRRKRPVYPKVAEVAEAVAGDGLNAATLEKDYSALMQRAPRDWRDPNYNPFAAAVAAPARRRRVLPKNRTLR